MVGHSDITSFQGELQFLYTFDAANASREIRTEQAAIGSFVASIW
jgi:hypothetical protein